MSWAKVVISLAVVVTLSGVLFTQETDKGKGGKDSGSAKPATYKVEKKPFKIEQSLNGILEAQDKAEISYRPQPMLQPSSSQGRLTISKIAAHGARVKQGDMLVAFETTKIDEEIDQLNKDKKSLDASVKLAEEELPLFEKTSALELAAAETAKKRANEELKYFLEVGKAQIVKEADMEVKLIKFATEFAQEELRQLEKMYKANDLTEETEKLILRRQQQRADLYAFLFQTALVDRDYLFNFTLPNREKALKDNQLKSDLQLEKSNKTQGPAFAQKREALAKMQFDRHKNAARLDKLQKDRAGMTIVSPMDGVVFHGQFQRGEWTLTPAQRNDLVPNGNVSAEDVLLTVVKPDAIVVRATIEEKDVHLFKAGLKGKVSTAFDPDRKVSATLVKVGSVPALPGKFDAEVALDTTAADAALMPGMACTVKLVPYANKDAIAVPSGSIHEEDDKQVVYVVAKNGKHQTREVTPGRSDGEHTEILAGLQAGEEILLEKPNQPTQAKKADSPKKKKGADQ